MKKNEDYQFNLKRFLWIALLFFAVTMPFRQLMQVMEVSEIRPASAFPPVFGLLYGWTGILACAVSNLVADILSGYSPILCAEGFVIQVIFGLLPFAIWKRLGGEVNLKSTRQLLRYNVLILLDAFVTAVLIGLSLQVAGIAPLYSITTLFLFLNNYVFGIVLGQPIILLRNVFTRKKGEYGSMHEQFIVVFLVLGILSAAIISIFAYAEVNHRVEDVVKLWNTVYIYISVDIFLFNTVTFFCLSYVEKNISHPVEGLAVAAREYVQNGLMKSDTDTILGICENYMGAHGEAGDLAHAYSTMLRELERYIDNLTRVTAEQERISAELNVATQIQADMLPSIFPAFPDRTEFKIYATMDPAKEVGGDFYDFFLIDEDHLAMVIADVSGKGVPAALFMVIAKTLIKNRAQMGGGPAEILSYVNDQLCEGNEAELFVTVWMAIVELSTGKGLAANAGHEHPVLCRKGGKYELVQYRHNAALAVMEGMPYREHEFQLNPGDRLYVYTDGVPEATNTDNKLYGTDRMLEALNRGHDLDGRELLTDVKKDLDAFVGDAAQFDDITMLYLEYYGNEK